MATTDSSSADQSVLANLRAVVQDIDALSQEGFSEISAIARLALASLETPAGCRDLNTIALALRSIWGKADAVENFINGRAESVGCNHVDESDSRRAKAWAAHRELGGANV